MNFLAVPLILALLGSDGTGTAVLPVMKIGQGPRASAMGESFTALADDASAVYWNPAGLGQLTACQFAFSHQQWFEGVKDEVVHAALPTGPGAVGLGLVYTGVPDVVYWDVGLGEFAKFRAWSAMLSAGYGFALARGYELGITAKGMYEDLRTEHSMGAGVDVGAVGHPVSWLGLGVVGRHLGTMSIGDGWERLPMEVAAGAVCGSHRIKVTADAVVPLLDNNPNFRAGLEFLPVGPMALRLGYRNGPVNLASLGMLSGLTAGLGVKVGNFGIDYAYVPYGELGVTHRLGIQTQLASARGDLTVIVLDATTRARLTANLAVSGAADTTATTDQMNLYGARPGRVVCRAGCDGYRTRTDTFRVVARQSLTDTMLLARLFSAIKGGIYDAHTKRPIGGTIDFSGPSSGTLPVVPEPGTYAINDVPSGRYALDAIGPTPDYLPQTCTLDVPAGETVQRDFYLWRKGSFLVLEGVNFETGKADILPQFYPTLDRAGEILNQTPSIKKVELAGHTDPRDINTTQFPSNWELSQARAEVARKYLVHRCGVAPERLTTRGYADTQPVASNATVEGMARNRRTELRIIE